ncbi:hypothetical protein BASA62_003780 [Batrachochytrium salamandrivorans]|nr:hypothetical protein BASA62_003780 [Batrachochytrium salamandrivorans]
MPSWYNDNAFIYKGYRRITNSYAGCARSLFYVHNETGNVYTHLVGVVIFLGIVATGFMGWMLDAKTTGGSDRPLGTGMGTGMSGIHDLGVDLSASVGSDHGTLLSAGGKWDTAVFGVFYTGAIVCLALSTTFHLCCCHSRGVLVMWNKADYVGIVSLIVGSFVPTIFYGFYCHPIYQVIYLCIFTLMGLGTIFVTLLRRFSSPQYRYFRTGLFVILGVSGAFPLLHAAALLGTSVMYQTVAMDYVLLMGAMYLLGAFIYAYRIPERWIHDTFDIWGHSHQIWHLLVLGAALIHYHGLLHMYEWRYANDPTCLA